MLCITLGPDVTENILTSLLVTGLMNAIIAVYCIIRNAQIQRVGKMRSLLKVNEVGAYSYQCALKGEFTCITSEYIEISFSRSRDTKQRHTIYTTSP
jgi:hypothetical protein